MALFRSTLRAGSSHASGTATSLLRSRPRSTRRNRNDRRHQRRLIGRSRPMPAEHPRPSGGVQPLQGVPAGARQRLDLRIPPEDAHRDGDGAARLQAHDSHRHPRHQRRLQRSRGRSKRRGNPGHAERGRRVGDPPPHRHDPQQEPRARRCVEVLLRVRSEPLKRSRPHPGRSATSGSPGGASFL